MGVHFEGTEGWIWVDRDGLEASPKSLLTSVIGPDEIHLPGAMITTRTSSTVFVSRAETVTPAHIAHRSIMIGHLGLIAMKLGRKVRWDPAAERFINDPEADRIPIAPNEKSLASVKRKDSKRQLS